MLALSINQPYASLLTCGSRRIENRYWHPGSYRGEILIHASLTKRLMRPADWSLPQIVFGAIVGKARLVAVMAVHQVDEVARRYRRDFGWLFDCRDQVEGPWVWIFTEAKALAAPVEWSGQRGLFGVPGSIFKDADWLPVGSIPASPIRPEEREALLFT